MTNATEAVRSVDALAAQLQRYVQDGRFASLFYDRLFGLRTVLGDARQRFMAKHGATSHESKRYADIQSLSLQATQRGDNLEPNARSIDKYGNAVEQVVSALDGSVERAAPGLRGALRIAGAPRPAPTPSLVPPTRTGRQAEPYYASLVKLFPVEAVTLYPLAVSIADGDPAIRLFLIGVIGAFVLTLRWFATQDENEGRPDLPAIGVAAISFALYVASLGGFGELPGGPEQTSEVFAFVTIMWVALVPYVLRRRVRS